MAPRIQPRRPLSTDLPTDKCQCVHVAVDWRGNTDRCQDHAVTAHGRHGFLCQTHYNAQAATKQTGPSGPGYFDRDAQIVKDLLITEDRAIRRGIRLVAAECLTSRDRLTVLVS